MDAFSDPDARWIAVQTRNPLASNSFIYSVITTRIYCRPTCPSRCARRANVIFHESAAAAEADGYRACKRCRPDVLEHNGEGEKQRKTILKACDILGGELAQEKKWAVKNLAAEVGLTESHFCRVFKKITGMTVGDYRARLSITAQGKVDGPNHRSLEESLVWVSPASDSIILQEHQSADANLLDWNHGSDKIPPDLSILHNPALYDFGTVEDFQLTFQGAVDNLLEPCVSTFYDSCLEDDGLEFFDFSLLSQDQLGEQ
ncbi:DNA repair and transcription factor ada [Phlyctema vagabunda]|uniref:DNA repair and transcription factor ada n=1 Tax=Phlyctema vagabunda TaxID=108571 RepID=A0ABR4PGE4_9HELO